MSKGRVLVAMSGGVDSSVAAVLLHEQGYEVVGVTMKTWDYETSLGPTPHAPGAGEPRAAMTRTQSGCCSLDDLNDARAVAVRLGVPHFVVDLRDEFGDAVTERFTADYLRGRTPNPCVLCNTHVKWGSLARRATALGCDHIATGHYARIETVGDGDGARWAVRRGVDRAKDQSYVLWGVSQAHLARTLLPLGGLTKPEIRRMAAEMGLDGVAAKPDSYEICFVPDDDYRGYLRRRVPGLEARVAGGAFREEASGAVVGRHEGYPFYTIGQRRGLGLALGEAVYVTRIEPETNTVWVGPAEWLAGRRVVADGVVWGAAPSLAADTPVVAQVRAHDPGAPALARATAEGSAASGIEAVFAAPRLAPAPGQALVLYDADERVVAGGWIAEAETRADTTPDDAFVALPTL